MQAKRLLNQTSQKQVRRLARNFKFVKVYLTAYMQAKRLLIQTSQKQVKLIRCFKRRDASKTRKASTDRRERTKTYVTKAARSLTKYCEAYMRLSLALALLVRLVLGTNNHNFAVALYNFAFIAHRFYGRSYFHNYTP